MTLQHTQKPPIIFTHYGKSSYLPYTLRAARKTNPITERRLVLLGDEQNQATALSEGWEHFCYEQYASSLRTEFAAVYRPINGKLHRNFKNGKDWLKYVFERWYCTEAFLRKEGIDAFWHFDSDTMIVSNLSNYDYLLSSHSFSTQCNGTCLNGFSKTDIVTQYCRNTISLFKNTEYLRQQQEEFDLFHPNWAFTEMRAFSNYLATSGLSGLRLLNLSPTVAFDECLCQPQGFTTVVAKTGETIKDVWSNDGRFFANRNEKTVNLVTLNLSWLQDYLFLRVLKMMDSHDLKLGEAEPSLRELALSKIRKIRRILKRDKTLK